MKKRSLSLWLAGAFALTALIPAFAGRFYDSFNSPDTNWTLVSGSGSAVISNSVLTLTMPGGVESTASATLNAAQSLTNSRQSILVRAHTGVASSTVFFLWAIDPATGNELELKLDDVNPTTVVAGFYKTNVSAHTYTYTFAGSAAYAPGTNGLYLAFQETNGYTYWEISTNASTWQDVATNADPVNSTSVKFEVQHKAYVDTAAATYTTVDCFNYIANGAGYHSLQNNTNSGDLGWDLYTEGFSGGNLVCSSSESPNCDITVNGVDASQHFTDTSIPSPYYTQGGYDFQITDTGEPTTKDYYNAYRYQDHPLVDADTWTYHLYFKYTYPQYITQGLEFPLNKYTGTNRIQAAVAWYPTGTATNGVWSYWNGTTWLSTGYNQGFKTNWWYEVTYTVGLHDNTVYYSGFSAGAVGSLVNWTLNTNCAAPLQSTSPTMSIAVQIDDNIRDTTTSNTEKNCYLAEWNIDWQDQKLP